MSKKQFIDHYEILEISPKATPETIERVFRYLAHRFHPDTSGNNDMERFNSIVEAYNILKDDDSRTEYDIEYWKDREQTAALIEDSKDTVGDTVDRHRLLSLFYAKRRRDMKEPGVGLAALEQITGCPMEVLEFHVWYFREKGWVKREESGMLAITAQGVDEIEAANKVACQDRLLEYSGPEIDAIEV